MSILCPSCNEFVDVVNVSRSGNVTVNTYSCGHKHVQLILEEKIQIKDSLRIKLKNKKGKVLIESKIEEQTEKRFSRKPSKAIQLVFKEGKIVHIHCKSEECRNEWKIKDEDNLIQKFDVKQNQQGIWIITCKKCGRSYLSG